MNMLVSSPALAIGSSATACAPPGASLSAIPPMAASPAAAQEDRALALWERRHALREPLEDAHREEAAAEARTAEWALPGRQYLNGDGTFSGHKVEWPAIQRLKPSGKATFLVRPGPEDLRLMRGVYSVTLSSDQAEAAYRRDVAALKRRLRAQARETERSGLKAATAALDVMYERVFEIEDEIDQLSPATPNAAAAQILVGASRENGDDRANVVDGAMPVAIIALTYLRPALRGIVKAHAEELLADQSRRIASYAFYRADEARARASDGHQLPIFAGA